MSSPLLWFGSAAKFLKSQLIIPASTSGQLTVQPAATTASYAITMPAAQGAASTVLTNDGAGNLSWSAGATPGPTIFSIANNQASFADVTGFLIDPTLHRAFSAEMSIVRQHATVVTMTDQVDTAFYSNLSGGFGGGNVFASGEASDGSVIVGGSFTTLSGNSRSKLVKVSSAGVEDTTFASNLGTGFTGGDVLSIAVQADDKILVAGSFTSLNGNTRNRLVRLNLDGTEDTAFYTNLGAGFDGDVPAVLVQADQKILVGGGFVNFNSNSRLSLVRLNSDGTEDTAFYTNLGTSFDSTVDALAEQADTKILVGGAFTNFNSSPIGALVRLNSDGTADSSFITALGTGFNASVLALSVEPTTDILVGGSFTSLNGTARSHLVRLSSAGSVDTSFSTNLGTGFDNDINSVAIQNTGDITLSGTFTTFNGNSRNYITRLNSSGTENSSFVTSLGTGFDSFVFTVKTQANQQMLIGGSFFSLNSVSYNRFLRYETLTTTVTDKVTEQTLKGVYHASTSLWTLAITSSVGDDVGVSLQMTNLGQLQYESTNLPGSPIVSLMTFTSEAL